MAIRFRCSGCSQPIEVDDEWASKLVACPYCRKTIAAPPESTLEDLSPIPEATPLGPSEASWDGPSVPVFGQQPPAPAQSNRLAVVALILACSLPVQLAVFMAVLTAHEGELQRIQSAVEQRQQQGESPFAAQFEAWQEFLDERGGIPPSWMILSAMVEFVGAATWIATIVCGIIAVRRPQRRRLAVVALVIAVVLMIFFCCGGVFTLGLVAAMGS